MSKFNLVPNHAAAMHFSKISISGNPRIPPGAGFDYHVSVGQPPPRQEHSICQEQIYRVDMLSESVPAGLRLESAVKCLFSTEWHPHTHKHTHIHVPTALENRITNHGDICTRGLADLPRIVAASTSAVVGWLRDIFQVQLRPNQTNTERINKAGKDIAGDKKQIFEKAKSPHRYTLTVSIRALPGRGRGLSLGKCNSQRYGICTTLHRGSIKLKACIDLCANCGCGRIKLQECIFFRSERGIVKLKAFKLYLIPKKKSFFNSKKGLIFKL